MRILNDEEPRKLLSGEGGTFYLQNCKVIAKAQHQQDMKDLDTLEKQYPETPKGCIDLRVALRESLKQLMEEKTVEEKDCGSQCLNNGLSAGRMTSWGRGCR